MNYSHSLLANIAHVNLFKFPVIHTGNMSGPHWMLQYWQLLCWLWVTEDEDEEGCLHTAGSDLQWSLQHIFHVMFKNVANRWSSSLLDKSLNKHSLLHQIQVEQQSSYFTTYNIRVLLSITKYLKFFGNDEKWQLLLRSFAFTQRTRVCTCDTFTTSGRHQSQVYA